MLRKFIVILISLIILAGAGYLVWLILKPKPAPPAPPVGGSLPVEEIPGGAGRPAAELSILSGERVFDYWLNKEGSSVWYFSEDGRIFTVDQEGKESNISPQSVKNLRGLIGSPDGSFAAVSYGIPNQPLFSIYNAGAANWLKPLPRGTVSAAWSPVNPGELIYLKDEGQTSVLTITNLSDGTEREIGRISQKDLLLNWVRPDTLYLSEPSSTFVKSSVWSFDLKTKALKQIAGGEPGLMALWTPDGEYALKFTSVNSEHALQVIDKNGELAARANVGITLPSKCAATNEKIYCAVPESIPAGAKLPDDYLMGSLYFSDTFVSINVSDWKTQVIFEPSRLTIDAKKLAVLGDTLYFINRYDGLLYKLTLE